MGEEEIRCLENIPVLVIDRDNLDKPENHEKQVVKPVQWTEHQMYYVQLIKKVCQSGRYNYLGCKVPVNHDWNFQLIRSLAREYHDYVVIDLLQFGFPVECSQEMQLEMSGINHKGATMFEKEVDRYIDKEIKLKWTIGPFEALPFKQQMGISPLSTQAKKRQ